LAFPDKFDWGMVKRYANQEVTRETVEAALSFLSMDGEYIGTEVDDSLDMAYVTITYLPPSYTDETDFAAQVGLQAATAMEVLFSNPAVDAQNAARPCRHRPKRRAILPPRTRSLSCSGRSASSALYAPSAACMMSNGVSLP
jgi:hypothetical protein